MRKEKVVVKLAVSPVAASQSGTGFVYVARPTLYVLLWSRLFRVSSRVSAVVSASPVQFIS
jgi:hypothetical protein